MALAMDYCKAGEANDGWHDERTIGGRKERQRINQPAR
jgi:hypothetical protein